MRGEGSTVPNIEGAAFFSERRPENETFQGYSLTRRQKKMGEIHPVFSTSLTGFAARLRGGDFVRKSDLIYVRTATRK